MNALRGWWPLLAATVLVLAALWAGCGDDSPTRLRSCQAAESNLDFGSVYVSESATRDFTVINTGTAELSLTATLQSPDFHLAAGDTVFFEAPPGDTARVEVVFAPSSVGLKSASLVLTGGPCNGATVRGEGVNPCRLEPETLDFGFVSVGRAETRDLTVTNLRAEPLAGSVSLDCAEFNVLEGAGSFTLETGESHAVTVQFLATELGPKTCTLELGTGLCSTVACQGSAGRTWNIMADGSGDAPTVQAGIDSAAVGDVVLVHPGTYHEVIDFKGKDIAVRSAEGPESTILDGSGFEDVAVVTFQNGESRAAVLDGLTVTKGERGVRILEAEPTVRRSIITQNQATRRFADYGAGIWCETGNPDNGVWSPLIEENRISENVAGTIAGGIGTWVAMTPEIRGNFIAGNEAQLGDGAGIYWSGRFDGTIIKGNVMAQNLAGDHGGGIYCGSIQAGANPVIEIGFNLILDNRANGKAGTYDSGGGVWVSGMGAWVHHNTLVGNEGHGVGSPNGGNLVAHFATATTVEQNIIAYSVAGGGLWCSGESTPTIRNNLAWQNTGGDGVGSCPGWWQSNGNIVADPQFCDRESGDYALSSTSPALLHEAGPLGAFPTPGCTGPVASSGLWPRPRSIHR